VRLHTRKIWVSTAIVGQPKAVFSTTLAVLRPTNEVLFVGVGFQLVIVLISEPVFDYSWSFLTRYNANITIIIKGEHRWVILTALIIFMGIAIVKTGPQASLIIGQ
jgi:hypothetical protein